MTFYLLQGLRFLAALIVLLFHLHLYRSGYKGVDIFFVISGFVMYYTLFCRDRPAALRFIINRVTKIFFLYWVALAFLFLVVPFRLDTESFQSFLLVPGHRSLLGVSWSLSYELYFYFAVGAAVYLLPARYLPTLFISVLCVSTAVVLINLTTYTTKGTIVNFLLGNNFWEFLLGIGAGYLALTHRALLKKQFVLMAGITALVLFLAIAIPYNHIVSYIIYGPISFLIVLCFARYEKQQSIEKRSAATLSILGDASYGIYLFGPVITLLFPRHMPFFEATVILSTIAFSILVNKAVENKVLHVSRAWLYRKVAPKR